MLNPKQENQPSHLLRKMKTSLIFCWGTITMLHWNMFPYPSSETSTRPCSWWTTWKACEGCLGDAFDFANLFDMLLPLCREDEPVLPFIGHASSSFQWPRAPQAAQCEACFRLAISADSPVLVPGFLDVNFRPGSATPNWSPPGHPGWAHRHPRRVHLLQSFSFIINGLLI